MGNSNLALPNKKYSSAQEEFIQFVKIQSKENVAEFKIKTAINRLHQQGYTLVRGIGAGSYGVVIEATNKQGQHVAMKIMTVKGKLDIQKYQYEAENCCKVKFSSNVVKYHECFVDEALGLFYLVTDMCPGGNLKKLLQEKDQTTINEDQIKGIIVQILQGIIDIHSMDIVHGDLKPENILSMDDGVLKICDFGFSKQLNQDGSPIKSGQSTFLYCASEQLKGELRKESDYFAVGAILFEMCNPKLSHKLRQLKNHQDPKDIRRYNFLGLTEIALSMMRVDPKTRVTPQEVILKLKGSSQDKSILNSHSADLDCTLGNNNRVNSEKASSEQIQNVVNNREQKKELP